MIEIKEMEKYADSKGLKMFIQFNVSQCRYDILFEKFGFVTKCYIPDNEMFDREDNILLMQKIIDEADALLTQCKSS